MAFYLAKSVLYGASVWTHRSLNSKKRRLPARAVVWRLAFPLATLPVCVAPPRPCAPGALSISLPLSPPLSLFSLAPSLVRARSLSGAGRGGFTRPVFTRSGSQLGAPGPAHGVAGRRGAGPGHHHEGA
jgi:hypothetical protein